MAERGCTRCGRLNMLQVTNTGGVEVRLCMNCREKAKQENQAASERKSGLDA